MAGVNSRSVVVMTEEKILVQMLTYLERVVMSPSLCMPVQILSSISVNSGF